MDSVFVMPGTVPAPRAGILSELHQRYETVRESLSRIDKAARDMGLPEISPRLIEDNGTSDRRGPEVQYLEIYAVSLATHHMLVAEGVRPIAIVGQSIGELWALAAAGHLAVEDAARLAVARSQALTRQGWGGKMLAVGVDGRRAQALAGLLDHPHLVLACENAPRQSVLSGPEPLIEFVERVADTLGWPSLRLDVPHPTHTPAMVHAARDLRASAPRVPYGTGRWRVCSPWLGRDVGDDDPVDLVAGALTARVRMLQTIRDLHAGGVDAFVECGEWPVVTKFVEASVPGVRCVVPLSEDDPFEAVRVLAAGPSQGGLFRERVSASAPSAIGRTAHASVPATAAAVTVPASPPPRSAVVPAPTPAVTCVSRVAEPVRTIAAPSVPAPVPLVAPRAQSTPSGLDYESVLDQLRVLYGDFLGYPPDLLGEDDGLESELGVESLKQVALLGRVSDRFDLPDLRADTSLLTLATLRRIAETVVRARAGVAAR
ncbi:acyltransferase domain-containing protein [Streptomyces sp. SID3343]|uniref:acyltransferase domain-containing protein n=1 Tax=Streptomyces sp. SID3343 TaxID=2690260 RepID=UPI001F259224|nr:acyltransferase domain-containing protein [Streptomyces sp. SID3343]